MSGYAGQRPNSPNGTTAYDGAGEFTEKLRSRCLHAVATGEVTEEFVRQLRGLANQRMPSHQAAYFLGELGISVLVPDYDTIVGEALVVQDAGYPHLAQLALKEDYITLCYEGDGNNLPLPL